MNVSSNIDTVDTPDMLGVLQHIDNNLNMIGWLMAACIGISIGLLVVYLMYKIIKWCMM